MKTQVILLTAGILDQRWPSAGLQPIPGVLEISPKESPTGSIATHTNEMLYTHDENTTRRILQTNINLIIFVILIA